MVDNHRVMHGRSAFDGKRRMCGAYIGVDDYRSKLTILNEKFAEQGTGNFSQKGPVQGGRRILSPLF